MTAPPGSPAKTPAARRLRVEKLSVERGGRLAIRDLGFSLAQGEALKVVGPNGAGKSTLLRAIAGLIPREAGSIALDGAEADEIAGEIHYLAHADGLRAALSVEENLEFWAAYLVSPKGAQGLSPREALARVSLAHVAAAPVGVLSAGQKRRVALARLLVAHRLLWLLDEPLTALDARARGQFAEAMREHCAAGGMILAATHEPLGFETTGEIALGARSGA